MTDLLRWFIVLVALGGFAIAFYIRRKKTRAETLICPLHSNCETVIHSPYSTFLGWPLELWGMFYYALVTLSYIFFVLLPVILWLTVFAFLFSLYLTYIQAVKLREWCTWCLISALFCSIIFLASLAIYQ